MLSGPTNRQFHESLCTVTRKSWKNGIPNAHRRPFTPHPHIDSPSFSASFPFMLLPPSCFLKFSLKYTICTHVLPLGSPGRRTQTKNISRESDAYKLMGQSYGDLASFSKGCHIALKSFLHNAHLSGEGPQLDRKSSSPLPYPTRLMRQGKEPKVPYWCSVALCNCCSGGKISTDPQFPLSHCTLSHAELLHMSLPPGRTN